MEKKTILAVVLSTVVLIGFYSMQALFFPRTNVPSETVQPVSSTPVTTDDAPSGGVAPTTNSPVDLPVPSGGGEAADEAVGENIPQETVIIETDLAEIRLSNIGGDLISFKLKDHEDGTEPVDMIFAGGNESSIEDHAFTVSFGDWKAAPVSAAFNVRRVSEYVVEFSRGFASGGRAFTLTKTYTFVKNEYMFRLDVAVVSKDGAPVLDSGIAYTLGFGPQIGPRFSRLDEQQNYRRYFTYTNGKLKQEKVAANAAVENSAAWSWTALAGKYFVLAAVSETGGMTAVFSQKPGSGQLPQESRLYLERAPLKASSTSDAFYFYLGPKTQDALGIYDNARSAFKFTDLQISKLGATSGFWSILNPLEWLLKAALTFFAGIFHNYGIAIILVTVLVKLLLFPLTKKSSEGTLRMQAIAPKIKELQEKYKESPQKLNLEMAALYKKEGYNPLSGCLPMLLQLPIFFAMYNLFNNHFDLRGALFIPGWIPDLSLPESVYNFGFRLPILGWTDIRILPFLYAGSQLIYGRVTQTPDSASNAQMKIFMYVMPIMFFFILYNVPSGLLVYWIMSNLLTMVQQLGLNKYLKKRKEALAAAEPPPKIIPRKKRKK